MDKDTEQLINETLTKFFESAPGKDIKKGIRPEYYDVCPHCKEEIYEKHEYTEDGGKTWRHSDCGGMIYRPETEDLIPGVSDRNTTDGLKQLGDGGFPSSGPGSGDQYLGDKEFGLEENEAGLPPSGEEKYSKQEPGGEMMAVNIAEGSMEEQQTKVVPPNNNAAFFQGQCTVLNKSKSTVKMNCTKYSVDIKTGGQYAAFYIKVEDA